MPASLVIVSGIQPSGRLHIGNYLGALQNFVDLQNSGTYQPYFFIADLHSLTESYTPAEKRAQILDLAANYLAAGLNPNQSILFIQSQVPAHTELAWILNTLTPMGELARMTQYKDKSERGDNNAGLFSYPVLMAADILLYDTALVPVGDDQDQHLELTRTLARKFNSHFGQTFFEPKPLYTATPRLRSLADPSKKMSKSEPAGCLFIDDEPKLIKKKIMSAVTDSGNEIKFAEQNKPGISNLLLILSAFSKKPISELEKEFAGQPYSDFKTAVAVAVTDALQPFRVAKAALLQNPAAILEIFAGGGAVAKKVADLKLATVYKEIGLV